MRLPKKHYKVLKQADKTDLQIPPEGDMWNLVKLGFVSHAVGENGEPQAPCSITFAGKSWLEEYRHEQKRKREDWMWRAIPIIISLFSLAKSLGWL